VRDADAVKDTVFNDGNVKVAADRIHACGPDTAARAAACNDEGIHFQFDENTEERSTVEGASVAFVDRMSSQIGIGLIYARGAIRAVT
jgi:hypothetical protein